MASVVQIVERLAPGGLETLALDLAGRLGPETRLFSLQGRKDELLHAWPTLENFSGAVEGFGRRPGLDVALIGKLSRRLRQLKPAGVIVHHIGPLFYGGIAARLSGVRTLIHVEHDSWHYSDRGHRAILRFAVHFIRPKRVAVSRQVVADTAGIARTG